MKMIFTAGQIKQSEEQAFAAGVSVDELMKNAGEAVRAEILKRKPAGKAMILCGAGNNGGDGFVCAARLYSAGLAVDVVLVNGAPKTSPAKTAFEKLPRGVNIIANIDGVDVYQNYAVVVDAIFGFGFHGRLAGEGEKAVKYANSAAGLKVAVDIPSGAERDSGKAEGECFKADVTVTFTALKPAMVLFPRAELMGRVQVADVGLPPQFLLDKIPFAGVMEERDAKFILPKRRANSHKGSFGSLVCCTGSRGMLGAAVLCARSALASGVGLVYQFCREKTYPVFAVSAPEAVAVFEKDLPDRVKNAGGVVCGCGLGQGQEAEKTLIRSLITDAPVILDADALNILAKNSELAHFYKGENMVLTPHPAEAGRLLHQSTREVQRDRFAAAKRLAFQYNCTALLKGAYTIAAAPKKVPVVIPFANSGLSKGGSGDCLAGIIGALSAQTKDGFAAACLGAYIHGLAGEICRRKMGEYSMQPSDLIKTLPAVYKILEK